MSTFESGLIAIAAIFLRFSNGNVYDWFLKWSKVCSMTMMRMRTSTVVTNFTRSNTETRLPTGLSTELPSEVKRMFP